MSENKKAPAPAPAPGSEENNETRAKAAKAKTEKVELAPYTVAEGKSLTVSGGRILGPGDAIEAADLNTYDRKSGKELEDGKAKFDKFVKNKYIVKN